MKSTLKISSFSLSMIISALRFDFSDPSLILLIGLPLHAQLKLCSILGSTLTAPIKQTLCSAGTHSSIYYL